MEVNYKILIDNINNLGLKLTEIIRSGNKSKRLLISHDLLLKIGYNVSVLPIINNLKNSTTSTNLIYRGIILDLMTSLFLLHLNHEEFEYSIKKLDILHVKYMKEVLPLRLELGRKIFKPKVEEDIDEQALFDKYHDFFQEYLKSEKGEEWDIITLIGPEGFTFNGKVKDIHEYLRKCDGNENLKALSNLYVYYKYLSQTEHYSFIGNKYPFKSVYDEQWNKECKIVIYAGIAEIDELLKQYY